MERMTTIELKKEHFKFSSGHFTIFSDTERENLHGHNFQVQVCFNAEVDENGIAVDYGILKRKIEELCQQLNEHFLLPANSPYLEIEISDEYIFAVFNKERIPFLKRDVLILPVANVTLEELSNWFLSQFLEDQSLIEGVRVREIKVMAFSGPGQSASAIWKKKS